MDLQIFPPEEVIETTIELPLSKSMSNRALIMNALTPAAEPLPGVAQCDDTQAMEMALAQWRSAAGQPFEANVGPAGTAMRFLTAFFAASPGCEVVLDGSERMRQRPIGQLVEALRQCGASVEYVEREGFPPLRIVGAQLSGGNFDIDASISSQFLSALLMVAPTMDTPLTLNLKGEIASLPYLHMTIAMMQSRGIEIEREGQKVTCQPGVYLQRSGCDIEHDWSAASYWYEIDALSAGWVTLTGLTLPSLQGDSALAQIFPKLGIVTEIEEGNAVLNPTPEMHSRLDLDLSATPDIAQTLAVTCCMLGMPFRFSGLKSLKIKETNRIDALMRELRKLSFALEAEADGVLSWEGHRVPVREVPPIETYSDHRMAMAFAPVALYLPGIVIRDADVVSKSYPGYWDDLKRAGFTLNEVGVEAE
ncbi:MAG: 3-phosphoshikimate 1-carboxyvinyltransferase [Bacteroidales bacterium]|nr:3-phosphoshikimate 1-carboxyvinyltransferase [Bacteroidales bacterium]